MFRPLKNYLLTAGGGGILVEQVFYFLFRRLAIAPRLLSLSFSLSLTLTVYYGR
ncbi:hypothetical protein BO85DRAFT_202228 [Aspergillus piperis CBS 112811]|uniref:Uncharacterized protein n=1 Tax=Aspergillus piperis CBS 112811 TaxID=1448313 RepID=A0A8G1QSX1_9EURO|nr:hypothetical protein BO85DRAFT_202228 [Aspergillus piperis CBS 112811]RAH52321.1 hypothetical protein BO85DRAFT_202228 [Aspergillus piperis CBS 112811]